MKATSRLFKYSVLLAAFLFLLPSNVSAWWWNSGPQCDDVVDDRGHLNVLTFNILFFAGGNYLFRQASVEATTDNIAAAIHAVNSQSGGGGTELLSAD